MPIKSIPSLSLFLASSKARSDSSAFGLILIPKRDSIYDLFSKCDFVVLNDDIFLSYFLFQRLGLSLIIFHPSSDPTRDTSMLLKYLSSTLPLSIANGGEQ